MASSRSVVLFSHRMKRYRDNEGGEAILEREISTVLEANEYFKQRGKINIMHRNVSEKKVKLLEEDDKRQNF